MALSDKNEKVVKYFSGSTINMENLQHQASTQT